MILPTYDREDKYWQQGMRIVAGVDEAGRGPLAGPVVAGAVAVSPAQILALADADELKLIRDSKSLSGKQREKAYAFITQTFRWGVGWSGHETIDRINILQAAFLAMKKAVSNPKGKTREDIQMLLVDGRARIPNMTMRQESIVGGDKFVFSIAAASIVAKVTRDRMMLAYHEEFPQYGFAKRKGYGTKGHFEMIERYGLCEIHRRSFAKSKIKNQSA